MKATLAVAALAGGVGASSVHHRHVHGHAPELFKKAPINDTESCGCTTIYSTYYGEATLVPKPVPETSSSTEAVPTTTEAPTTATSVVVVVPTPIAQTCPTTGVYTFPATTVTLTETTAVYAVSTTKVPSGTHTLGGVTTVVSTATTVTCPYATETTSEGVTTGVIKTTTYVCPSAGTYTVAPTTTTVTKETTIAVPTVSTYVPGTYTQPEITTTITETSTVVYCPFENPATSSAVPVKPTTPAESYPTSVVPVPPVESSPTKPSATSSVPTSKPSAPSGNGNAPWAITYTPYDSNGQCKTKDAVDEDIAAIASAGISTVRVYSTDCDTLPNVGGACEAHGIRIIAGIFIEGSCSADSPDISDQISALKEWAKWDLVDILVIGNEAIFNGHCTAAELANVIKHTKSQLSGFNGLYTTTDTVAVWEEKQTTAALCDVVDIVGAQAHAYFNTQTKASEAGKFVKGQLDIVSKVCAGKEARILETGWPHDGLCNEIACAGEKEQEEAIASLLAEVKNESVFFSLTDDKWKDPNTDCQCEQSWGCYKALGLSGLSSL